jgi:phosphatidylglycerophosphatase A
LKLDNFWLADLKGKMKSIHYIIATGLGVGYSPIAPGTAGSLLALLIAVFLLNGNSAALAIITVLLFFIGTYSASFVKQSAQKHDPQMVVVDEMVGMWISLLFVPLTWWGYLLAFGLFRFFDIVKPFPVDSFQKLPNGWGIMMDDVGAGVYALLVMQIVLFFV